MHLGSSVFAVGPSLVHVSVVAVTSPRGSGAWADGFQSWEQLFRLKVVYKVHASVLRCTKDDTLQYLDITRAQHRGVWC